MNWRSSEHFLRVVFRRRLCIKVRGLRWVRWWCSRWGWWGRDWGWWLKYFLTIFGEWDGDQDELDEIKDDFSFILRKTICVRDKEGWVQVSPVARYLLPLQSLQNKGETRMSRNVGGCVWYDDNSSLFVCKVFQTIVSFQANVSFSGRGKVFHNSQW